MKNKQKGFIAPLLITLVAILLIGGGVYVYSKKNTNTEKIETNVVGSDRDAHGCIGSAGYSWCEVKNKCLRIWEEKCEVTTTPEPNTATENASGIIKSVYSKNGKNYIDIDYVEINPNFIPGGVPGGGSAYKNENPNIRTFELSSSARFVVGVPDTALISFSDFQKFFKEDTYQASNPWDIIVVGGVVTQITEHYVP